MSSVFGLLGVDSGVSILMNLSKCIGPPINGMVTSSPISGLSPGSPGCSCRFLRS